MSSYSFHQRSSCHTRGRRSGLAIHSHKYNCHQLDHTTLHFDICTLIDSICHNIQQDMGCHTELLSTLANSRMYHLSCHRLRC